MLIKKCAEFFRCFHIYVAPAAGGKAPAKPAKGAPAAVAAVASSGNWNPLVRDPDELAPCAAPTDPLVVGAFTVLQRVGIVQVHPLTHQNIIPVPSFKHFPSIFSLEKRLDLISNLTHPAVKPLMKGLEFLSPGPITQMLTRYF